MRALRIVECFKNMSSCDSDRLFISAKKHSVNKLTHIDSELRVGSVNQGLLIFRGFLAVLWLLLCASSKDREQTDLDTISKHRTWSEGEDDGWIKGKCDKLHAELWGLFVKLEDRVIEVPWHQHKLWWIHVVDESLPYSWWFRSMLPCALKELIDQELEVEWERTW